MFIESNIPNTTANTQNKYIINLITQKEIPVIVKNLLVKTLFAELIFRVLRKIRSIIVTDT